MKRLIKSLKTILLPHQRKILLSLFLLMLASTIFWYVSLTLFSTPQGEVVINQDQLAKCTNNFCELLKKIHNHPENIIQNGTDIFINNLIATYYIFVTQPLVIYPLLGTFSLGSILGNSLFNSPQEFITELLLPHGLIEITSFLFIYSLFYAILVNFFLIGKKIFQKGTKKVCSFNQVPLAQVFIQICIFLALLYTAGLLEAIGIASKV